KPAFNGFRECGGLLTSFPEDKGSRYTPCVPGPYGAAMSEGFYLGKELDPKSGRLGDRVLLDPADLLTHGLVVGMTGSGKTGLPLALLEEALRQKIPVLAVDPKGDLGNLLLLFEKLDAASFEPWIDPEAARRDGKDVKAAAAEPAAAWTEGHAARWLSP